MNYVKMTYVQASITSINADVEVGNSEVANTARFAYVGGSEGSVKFINVNVDNVTGTAALSVFYGNATFRGKFSNLMSKAIESACVWGAVDCSVDATYTDWVSAQGPNGSSGSLVCGQVTVSPWKYQTSTYSGSSLFDSPNCNNDPTPERFLAQSVGYYLGRVDAKQLDCTNGYQDACSAISTAHQCLGSAISLASNNYDVSLPSSYQQISNAAEAESFEALLLDSAKSHVDGAITETALGDNAQFVNAFRQGMGIVMDVNQAYNTCAP